MISSTNHQMAQQQIREDRWDTHTIMTKHLKYFVFLIDPLVHLHEAKLMVQMFIHRKFSIRKIIYTKKSICSSELSSFPFY